MLRLLSSLLALAGMGEALYLTIQHYAGEIPPCSVVSGCETVLTSPYATIVGIPIALLGVGYYLTLLVLSRIETVRATQALVVIASLGLIASAGLTYLQVEVIKAVCLYCLTSAGLTLLIWLTSLGLAKKIGAAHAR